MKLKETLNKIKKILQSVYLKINDFTGGVPEILRLAVKRFGEERGSEASASLAYYTFFLDFSHDFGHHCDRQLFLLSKIVCSKSIAQFDPRSDPRR